MPTVPQWLLLTARPLSDEDPALVEWSQLIVACDFGREDSASIELAGLAEARFGPSAGDRSGVSDSVALPKLEPEGVVHV